MTQGLGGGYVDRSHLLDLRNDLRKIFDTTQLTYDQIIHLCELELNSVYNESTPRFVTEGATVDR